MSAYLDTLASFVPDLILRRANEDAAAITVPTLERFPAGVLFADISGFTALTERLAVRGVAGAEDLTAMLNGYFGEMIEVIHRYGGDTVKFAGDAMLALWRADVTGEELGPIVHRMAQCAYDLQMRLHDHEVAPGVRLSVKLAIGAGEVMSEHLGGVFERWEFLVAGPPLAQVGLANDLAEPGDVMMSAEAAALVPGIYTGDRLAHGVIRLRRLMQRQRIEAPASLLPVPEAADALRTFIPGAIRSKLDAGQGAWLGELRRISVLFVNLPDFNVETPLERAHEAMRTLQMALYRFEGSINKMSVDDKGASLIGVLGLPPLAHENDPERAVRAALAMREGLAGLGFGCSIGVTTGTAFCGAVGNERRREYTIMGDVVNLSARLMQAAGGGILCDDATFRPAGQRLPFESREPIKVKGKAEPVAIHRPLEPGAGAATEEKRQARAVRVIGRAAERARFAGTLEALVERRESALIAVEGEAGIGKSRLLQDLLKQAEARGVFTVIGGGDPVETATPYRGLRQIFGQFYPFAMNGTLSTLRRRTELMAELPPEPTILQMAPLLEVVLPLEWRDNEHTAPLQGKLRADRTHQLLTALIAAASQGGPALLVMQDAQWLDSASWSVLVNVAEAVTPLLVVLETRPFERGEPEGYQALLARPSAQRMRLGGLERAEIGELACQRLGVDAIPEAALDLLSRRAEGNPLYAEELAYALRDAGTLVVEDGRCRLGGRAGDVGQLKLPDTVQGLITGRIDRLDAAAQMTMKVASVVGRRFDVEVLSDIHPLERSADAVEAHCRVLHDADLTPRVRQFSLMEGQSASPAFKFKSNVTLEVAYDLMLFSQRRQLHEALARWFERRYADDLHPFYALLAHHWARAAEGQTPDAALVGKAADYYEKAGRQAVRDYANAEAILFFREALAQLARLPDDEDRARAELRLQLALGGPLVTTRSYADPDVQAAFARAQDLCDRVGDHAQLFEAVRGMWQFRIGQSDYAEAARLGAQLVELADKAGARPLQMEANRCAGNTAFWTGDFVPARERMERAVTLFDEGADAALAEKYGQDPDVANRGILAWTLCFLGLPDAASGQACAALARAERLRHPFSLVYAHGANMWTHRFLRNAAAAEKSASDAIEIANERGFAYLKVAAHVVRGAARAAQAQGDKDRGEAGLVEIAEAIEGWRRAGVNIGLPLFVYVQADTLSGLGMHEEALATLDDPALVQRLLVERWYEAETWRTRADCLAALGAAAAEVDLALRRGLELAVAQGARMSELRLLVAAGHIGSALCDRRRLTALYADIAAASADPSAIGTLAEAAALLEEQPGGARSAQAARS